MSEEPLIAVFVDYENLALGVKGKGSGKIHIELVMKRLLERGRIVHKKAYCDWSQYRAATRDLHSHGIELIDIPRTKMSGKNSADIHMVVDALDLCYAKEHIDYFALLTGDSDFSPLVSKLKENDKRVVGCGVKDSTSNLLIASCDEFIYYDDLVREADKQKEQRSGRAKKAGRKTAKEPEAIDQLLEVLRSLDREYDTMWGSMVKQTIRRVHPSFNESYHGYMNFSDLLKDAEKRGLINLDYDASRGNYRVRLGDDEF